MCSARSRTRGALQVEEIQSPDPPAGDRPGRGIHRPGLPGGVVVKRKDENGKEKEIKINARSILRNKQKDLQLLENDTVYVPESLLIL